MLPYYITVLDAPNVESPHHPSSNGDGLLIDFDICTPIKPSEAVDHTASAVSGVLEEDVAEEFEAVVSSDESPVPSLSRLTIIGEQQQHHIIQASDMTTLPIDKPTGSFFCLYIPTYLFL